MQPPEQIKLINGFKINEVSLIILVQCSKIRNAHEFYDLDCEVPFSS